MASPKPSKTVRRSNPDGTQRILVVDDEQAITNFVSFNLMKDGYEVDVCFNGTDAVDMARKGEYDLIVLDVMLPAIDGYEACRRIREFTNVPVLFLSARDTELDKVVGLEIGGDDYLAKPFGIRELLARVHALLRRIPGSADGMPQGRVIEVNGIRLDESAHTAVHNGQDLGLTPREFELLTVLMSHAGAVLAREQLLKEAWDWHYVIETKTVDTHIKRLRDKLAAGGIHPGTVETVRGYGYRYQTGEAEGDFINV